MRLKRLAGTAAASSRFDISDLLLIEDRKTARKAFDITT